MDTVHLSATEPTGVPDEYRRSRLCSNRRGYAFAKFAGRTISFGRTDDPDSRTRFHEFKLAWLANGRQVTEEILAARNRRRL